MPLNSYKPAKFLQIQQITLGTNAVWPNDGTTYAGFAYRYDVQLNVTAQPHDNPAYNNFFYDGTSINVGDWIFTTGDGFLVKIVSISSQTNSTVMCVVEDVDQANLYSDPSQSQVGIGADGSGYLFEVVDGMPVVAPIPLTLAAALPPWFTSNLMARFFKDKTATEIEVQQVAHGFTVGQAIYLTSSGAYALASASTPTSAEVAGFVTYTDSSPDSFKYRPVGPLVNITMPAGNPGDVVYLDTTAGGLTTTQPGSNVRRMFIRVSATSGIYLGGQQQGTGTGPQGYQGPIGPQGSGTGGGIVSYFAQLNGAQGAQGPLWVEASGLGIEYIKTPGNFTIKIPSGVEITSAKVNLQQSDTATLNSVQFAIDLVVIYADDSRNNTVNDVNYPTVTFVDESVISLGGTQPTLNTPFQFKPLGNSLSCQLIDISAGQATFRIQQLNFDFVTLILNF